MPLPLHIFEPRYKLMINRCVDTHHEFGIVLAKPDGIAEVGCTAAVVEVVRKYPDGKMDILTEGRARYHVLEVLEEQPYYEANVEYLVDDGPPTTSDLQKKVLDLYDRCCQLLFGRPAEAADTAPERSVESALRADRKETAANARINDALREAVFGNPAQARQAAAEALKLAPTSQSVEIEAALVLARAGDAARAQSLTRDLGKRFPLDTLVQSIWLPTIEAELQLRRNKPAAAIARLPAPTPMDYGYSIWCMYPTYVRGEAYLAGGQGTTAASEFQKILDHTGIIVNCATGALASVGLARANALESRIDQGMAADAARARALAAYRDFFALWKDADPDIPILTQAKAEYAKLHRVQLSN